MLLETPLPGLGRERGSKGAGSGPPAALQLRLADGHGNPGFPSTFIDAHDAPRAVEVQHSPGRILELDAETDLLADHELLGDDEVDAARADVARDAGGPVLESDRDLRVHALAVPWLLGH